MSNDQIAHSPSPPLPPITKQAVEVVAMLGDSVVGVRHVADPKSGVVQTATKALLGAGCAMLATSAIAFGYAAHIAAKNDAALKAFEAKGKPAWAFRPEMVSPIFDLLTIGGSGLGLAALVWGLSRRKNELLPSRVRLGTAPGCDFALDGVGAMHDLIAPMGDGFAVHVAPGMTGATGTIPVSPTTRLRLQLGNTMFHVQSVPAAKKTGTGFAFDKRPLAFVAASVVAHLGLIALLDTVPADSATASGDDDPSIMIDATAETSSHEELPPPVETGDPGADANKGKSSAMTLPEGQMGTDHPSADPGKRQVANRGPQSIARNEALERAREAGILGSSYFDDGDRFAAVTGTADITSGMSDNDIYGSWDGNGDGSLPGFGNGRRGTGPGGGGKDPQSIWTGAYDTVGTDPNGGDPFSTRDGHPLLHKRNNVGPVVKPSEPILVGDGDAAIVRRYIKRNAAKITFCYEKQLLGNPGLSGTVATQFTVMPNGNVVESTASGVDGSVSSCVAQVISNIQFPAFKSPFQVKYPFFMHPAGSGAG